MSESFTVGSGHSDFVTNFIYDTFAGNIEIRRGARTIVVPANHLFSFVATLVRREKAYKLEMMTDKEVIGVEE